MNAQTLSKLRLVRMYIAEALEKLRDAEKELSNINSRELEPDTTYLSSCVRSCSMGVQALLNSVDETIMIVEKTLHGSKHAG